MTTRTPTPVPGPPPAPTPRATATSASPVSPAQASTPVPTAPRLVGPPDSAPAPVTRAQASTPVPEPAVPTGPLDTAPNEVTPGAGTGTSGTSTVTVTVPVTESSVDTSSASTTNNNVVVTTTKPGGQYGEFQYNSRGTFGGYSGLTVGAGGLVVSADTMFLTPGSSLGSERYITFKTPGLQTIMAWGIYANNIIGQGPSFQWYGPTGGTSLFYTNLAAGNIVFPNGGEEWPDIRPPYGMMIGTDLKFYNSKSANAALGNVGINYSDGTYQYTTVKASNQGAQISNSVVGLNFTGSGVTATNSGGNITITIPGGGTSTIAVQEEGTNVVASANTINFVGSGVTASNVGGVATITISSGGSGSPGEPNASIQFNDSGNFAGNSYFTFNKTNGNVDLLLGNLTVSNGNITGTTNGVTLGYRHMPQTLVNANVTLANAYTGGHLTKWEAGDITITAPWSSSIPVGAKVEIFNSSNSGNANVVAGTNAVLVGPRPGASGVLTYVSALPGQQVSLVNMGVAPGGLGYNANTNVWFAYGGAYPFIS